MTTATMTDTRFTLLLFTPSVVAVHLGLPETTVRTWLGLARSPALVTYLGDKTHPRMASVPFVGLAEASCWLPSVHLGFLSGASVRLWSDCALRWTCLTPWRTSAS